MNICIVTSSFPVNRKDQIQAPFTGDFIQACEELGHKVFVVTQDKEGEKERVFANAEVHWFSCSNSKVRLSEWSLKNPFNYPKMLQLFGNGMKAVQRVNQLYNIDLFFCFWAIPGGLYCFLARKLLKMKTPYVNWCLGSDVNKFKGNMMGRSVLKLVLNNSLKNFADGFVLCDEVRGISKSDCTFLPSMRSFSTRLNINADKDQELVRFLFVGRMAQVKGPDVLIDAIKELSKRERNFMVDFIGDGPLLSLLKDKIVTENLASMVRLHGKCPTEKLLMHYQKASAVVIPSRSESIPLVMGEALTFGNKLIVSNVGDMGDLVRKYKVGEVFEPENCEALKDLMLSHIKKPDFDPGQCNELLKILNLPEVLSVELNSLEEEVKKSQR